MPEGLDLFSWSLPFLAEKVTSMLYQILKQCTPSEMSSMENVEIPEDMQRLLKADDSQLETTQQKTKRKLILKNKIQSVGRMNLMLANMRKN